MAQALSPFCSLSYHYLHIFGLRDYDKIRYHVTQLYICYLYNISQILPDHLAGLYGSYLQAPILIRPVPSLDSARIIYTGLLLKARRRNPCDRACFLASQKKLRFLFTYIEKMIDRWTIHDSEYGTPSSVPRWHLQKMR